MTEIPVLLLTGYLGSGKTTLLNRILSNNRGIRFAVIVNDIGEVNIDATLIQQGGIVNQNDDSLVALQNGCICCTLKSDLVNQLRDIANAETTDALTHSHIHAFDYIVIEASGICEPEPIAQTLISIPTMAEGFHVMPRLDCIVTVVDTLRMRDEFEGGALLIRPGIDDEDIENLVVQQIEFCNIVLLNKASEVTPEELGRTRQIVRTLQPKAEIIECNYGDVDFDRILHTDLFDFDATATSATWIQEVESGADVHHHEEEHHQDHNHEHHHHHDDEGEAEEYGIGTYVYYRRRAFDLNAFDSWVARNWPKGIIRTKGICYFDGEEDKCYLFEQAGKQVSLRDAGRWFATMPPTELREALERDAQLRRDWDEYYGDRMQKLVFIGQHLDKELIERSLDECLV